MGKIKMVLLTTGVVALGSAALAGASLADGKRGHQHERGMRGGFGPGFLERLDTDGDGRVMQAEIDQMRRDRLAQFDQNGDGELTLEEYQALWLSLMRERMVDSFQALDDDGDAAVTAEEYTEPFSRMVSRLDRDGDGELTAEEMRRRGRGHDHGGKRGGR